MFQWKITRPIIASKQKVKSLVIEKLHLFFTLLNLMVELFGKKQKHKNYLLVNKSSKAK